MAPPAVWSGISSLFPFRCIQTHAAGSSRQQLFPLALCIKYRGQRSPVYFVPFPSLPFPSLPFPSLPFSPLHSMSSSPPPAPPPAPNVELLFGPLLIGTLLNTTLYGVLLVQMLMYFTRYKRDGKWLRFLALYLLIGETVNTVFDIGLIYEPLIVRYATTKALEVSPLLLRPDAAVTVLISTPIQLFVAWRVKIITKSYLFPALISILSIISLGGGLSVTIIVSLHSDYADFGSFHPYVITWLSSTAACDVILSAALIYSLYTRKTGVRPTDRYVDRIIRLTVQTGSITAVTALLDLLVFLFKPNTTLQFIWDFPLSKLYSNALLSTLNARIWTEEAAHPDVNVLFEQAPGSGSGQIDSVTGHYNVCGVYSSFGNTDSLHARLQPPIELHRRRREVSTHYVNHRVTQDLERGHDGGDDDQKDQPL
ncbi:hypothetical protein DFH07DRAFT_847470 [Mycena maculata]|uniref:DUF6534 domain-containing protein n=1 Tax=Mycena maculata TaxID=230809 RepID=A0AAD7HYM0_9AGAR|nr:hypothetical protein DFH07DRAFT_847470 [Mycena maculata]